VRAPVYRPEFQATPERKPRRHVVPPQREPGDWSWRPDTAGEALEAFLWPRRWARVILQAATILAALGLIVLLAWSRRPVHP
jgi:hypothetical protein